MIRPSPPNRWLRAAVLGVSSVALAATGHLLGGGHVEPVFLALLIVAMVVGAHAWLTRERGLAAITAAVVIVQVAVHLGLSVGHDHRMSVAMLCTHAGAALGLAVFLRCGEAHLHAAARRHCLRLLVGRSILLASLPRPLPTGRALLVDPRLLTTLWIPDPGPLRGPPASAGH